MPEEFTYLTRLGRSAVAGMTAERTANQAVEARYGRADLAKRLVVRDELRNRYLVFESREEFLEWYETVPEKERCCHEVVFGWAPQRLKFDVDAQSRKLDALSDGALGELLRRDDTVARDDAAALDDEVALLLGLAAPPPAPTPEAARESKVRAVLNLLIEAILDELYFAYLGVEDLVPTRDDLVITDSSGATPDGIKYSFHILVRPYFVANNEEAREFTTRVLERLPHPVRTFVDPDVNKRTQNFRLVGSAKPGTGRFKRATPEAARMFGTAADVPDRELFVTAPHGARILQRVYTEEDTAPRRGASLDPQDALVRAALDLAAREGVTDGHSFSDVRGTMLCFERVEPSHCRICGETHHKDNSLMISINEADGGMCRVMEHCRQARGRARFVGEIAAPAPAARSRSAAAPPPVAPAEDVERIAARVKAISENKVDPHAASESAFERLPDAQRTVYSEGAMRPFETDPKTLAVAAQMGLGKTNALENYIAELCPADGLETHVIRFVTFRQTFSNSILKKFPDFVLYNSVAGILDHVRYPRLIVQVESLHRLKIGPRAEPIDLLILDEVESILAQFNSGLHKNFNAAFAAFQWMVKTARRVVCMDANLGDRTYRTLARLRPAHPIHFHWNRFARAGDDVYRFTADQGAWLGRLYAALRGGARVVIPTNSLTEARTIDEAVRREFKDKKVMLYSSEMSPSEKARHFGDVHTYWGDLDVLIYTPTCSAGVSFELDHFDVLFGYFCDVSCDVETCRQMLGRIRSIRTREHYICIRATGAALPTTVERIAQMLRSKRAGLFRGEDVAVQFEYADDGEIRFYESDYYYLWLETVRVNNLSRNDFTYRFIDQVADTGARVEALAAGDPEAGAALLLAHRGVRDELAGTRNDALARADDLTSDEAAQVRDSLRGQEDVDPEVRLSYEKFQLRETYDWHGRPLDAKFAGRYNRGEVRRIYHNLQRITEGASVLDSLRLMRAQEAGHYDYVMEMRTGEFGCVNESRDLVRDKTTYVFQAHSIAIWLLRLCGFECVTDGGRVHEELLEARLRSAIPALRRALDGIIFEFEIPRPNLDRLERETDRARFLRAALRTVNAVTAKMYGIRVQRLAKRVGGDAYQIVQGEIGKLFAEQAEPDDAPGGPRPHIASNLKKLSSSANKRINLFLEHAYYGATPGEPADGDDAASDPDSEHARALDEFLTDAFEEFVARTENH